MIAIISFLEWLDLSLWLTLSKKSNNGVKHGKRIILVTTFRRL